MSTPLEDYAVVGDMATLAVVSRAGSVDWLCWPRFDSPSIFGALLDDDGGAWSIESADAEHSAGSRQVYLSGTNVLLTRFHGDAGVFEIEDFMAVTDAAPDADDPSQHLIRAITCRRGDVSITSRMRLRPDYGRATAAVEQHGAENDGRISISAPGVDLVASGTVDWQQDGTDLVCSVSLTEGETAFLVLGSTALDAAACDEHQRTTLDFWRRWSTKSSYSGRWREQVERSALILKLLTHGESGGIIAAGTTSLPEIKGGERNWDYRYVWIRDAAFTVYAFIALGYLDEADAFTDWLTDRLEGCDDRLTDNGQPPLAPLYDLDGNSDLTESELDHWSGYADSTPVRIGNAASDQMQLDIYGELIDALYLADKHGDGVSLGTWSHIVSIIDWLGGHWQEPDDGIWEARSGPQRHTASLLLAWVAVERAIRMANHRGRPGPLEQWRALRDEMHRTLVDRGFNTDLGAFTQVLDGDTVDASLLLAPLVKFVSPTDPSWLSTLDLITERLAHGPLVDRYDAGSTDDGLDGEEGSFTICSFWYVEALARSGRVDEARMLFDRLLSFSSPTGIFSEEIGPDGRLLGNFPQAFTHLALISAATYLDRVIDD